MIDSFVADISNMSGERISRLPWRIGDGQRCNLTDARTTINGQHQAKVVARGLEDAEHSADVAVAPCHRGTSPSPQI